MEIVFESIFKMRKYCLVKDEFVQICWEWLTDKYGSEFKINSTLSIVLYVKKIVTD